MGKNKTKKRTRRPNKGWLAGSSATQTICSSFLLVIAVGTLLLTLPISSRTGRLGVIDALFTATSATCVTGLVVRDTWSQFSLFGQVIILMLIQVGGLGLVTLTSFFALAARRRMGFRDLRLLGESVSADGLSKATEVLKIVIKLAAAFEAVGIVLLLFAFVPQFGAEGVWVSVFTAISAFCNAGFDLFGRFGAYSSLVPYVNNYYVQAVIMFMIMAGGLGFMVWVELAEYRKKRRLSLHAKVVLQFSVIFWVGGAVLLALLEWSNPRTMGGLSVPGKIMAALFQSVTLRTAGFATFDQNALSDVSKAVADFLMLVIVNRKEQTYTFLQLNRDTMTEINLIGRNGKGMAIADMQLCTAHWYGGTPEESCENTVKAVSRMLGGVKINGYYAINMEDIGKLNHAIGGVTVTIDSDFGDVDPTLKKGETVTLSDEQAYNFLRYRQGIDDSENTSRMKRHRQYMQAFMAKLKKKMHDDPSIGAEIYEQMSEVAVTDMSGGVLTDILTDMQQATNRGTFELEGTTKLGQHLDDGLEHTEFYLDKMAIVKTLKDLYNM